MHYFNFNIGDYASHTKGLSLLEDIAYRRMIDEYYTSEKPLEGPAIEVARLIGMREHQPEVDYVLKKYFQYENERYFQKRIDADIAKYQRVRVAASDAGKASGEARRNAALEQSLSLPLTNPQPTNNQEPITNNHIKDKVAMRDIEFCEWSFGLILKVMPSTPRPRNFDSWAVHVRRMREIDKLDLKEMARVFRWANSDDFWDTNIRSTAKLRKQFPVLQAKMKKEMGNENRKRPTAKPSKTASNRSAAQKRRDEIAARDK